MNQSIFGIRTGGAPVPLSLLDFAMTDKGVTTQEAPMGSIRLVHLADRHGFSRYWLAEHHATPGVITSSSPLLLVRLTGETTHIRLGAGGMMLPDFPPSVMAEQFGLLASLVPGRIDLGVGRASGADMVTASALRCGNLGVDSFPKQLGKLLHSLKEGFPESHPRHKAGIYAAPGLLQDEENAVSGAYQRPPVRLLGSSDYSACSVVQTGLPFAFAAHLADQNVEMVIDLYRQNFRPSAVLDRPYVIASFGVMAADGGREVRRQAWAYSHAMMCMSTDCSSIVPTPQETENYEYSPVELRLTGMQNAKIMSGTGDQVVD